MIKNVKIPEDRVAVLFGKGHKILREIESLGVKIKVVDNNVEISGDALNVMTAENIIRAIGRGFSPEKAMELKKGKALVIINLRDYVPEKSVNRQKARVIGEGGKARKKLEEITETFISVYGKTVSVIGDFEKVEKAKRAIEKLITGASHRSVYEFLERVS